MDKSEFTHRFYNDVLQNIERAENLLIIHGGENVKDLFYSPYMTGFAHKTLIHLFLREHVIAKVVLLSEDWRSVELFMMSGDKVSSKKLNNHAERVRWLINRQDCTRRSGIDRDSRNSSGNEAAERATAQANGAIDNCMGCLRDIGEFLESSGERAAVIVQHLDKRAMLYEGKDHSLEYLEEIERWTTIGGVDRAHLVVVFMPFIDILKRYWHFEEESLGVIKVGRPTHAEITQQFKVLCKFRLTETTLEKCATLAKGDGLKLKNAIHIFRMTVAEMQNVLRPELEQRFFETFKGHVKRTLDEEVAWDDVILVESTKREIMRTFEKFLQNKGKLKTGAKGIIFHGPPGTGKTRIAKALANRQSFYFMAPKLADIKGKFIGHSSDNVKKMFDEARNNAPTLIFLDELDTLFPMRGASDQDSFQRDITNQFLAEVDGVDSGKQDIFIIGATNLIQTLDSAILSRFQQIKIGLPEEDERAKIFSLHLKEQKNSVSPEDLAELVKKSDGLSGRDIAQMSEKLLENLNDNQMSSTAIASTLKGFHEELASMYKDASFSIHPYRENGKPNFSDVVGYEPLKEHAASMVQCILDKERLVQISEKLADYNGLLLYGPPGNGKTFFAQALGNEMKLDFVKVVGASLATSMHDGAIKVFDDIVQKATKLSALRPIMLFFDEFDAIAGPGLDAKLRGTILDRITMMRSNGNIVLMGATNHYNKLDDATIRKGRFDEHILLPHPSGDSVGKLLEFFCRKGNFDVSNLNFEALHKRIDAGYVSSSDIENFCLNAQRRSVQERGGDTTGIMPLRMEHFDERLDGRD